MYRRADHRVSFLFTQCALMISPQWEADTAHTSRSFWQNISVFGWQLEAKFPAKAVTLMPVEGNLTTPPHQETEKKICREILQEIFRWKKPPH